MISSLGGKIWGPKYIELTKEKVDEAHKYGLRVVTWTADSQQAIEMLVNMGVDGLITDRPDLARSVLAAKGYKLPPSFNT
jgi:glycerophosphoryl diester phosphodiesterase